MDNPPGCPQHVRKLGGLNKYEGKIRRGGEVSTVDTYRGKIHTRVHNGIFDERLEELIFSEEQYRRVQENGSMVRLFGYSMAGFDPGEGENYCSYYWA